MNLAIFTFVVLVISILGLGYMAWLGNRRLSKAKKQGKEVRMSREEALRALGAEAKRNADLIREIQAKDAYISRLEDAVYGKKYPGVTVTDTNF